MKLPAAILVALAGYEERQPCYSNAVKIQWRIRSPPEERERAELLYLYENQDV
jgi:hypothetical protein